MICRSVVYVLVVGLILTASPFCLGASEECCPPRPNIVFIVADDLGYGDLSCFGQSHFQTPRIDRLAAEGLRLTQHYAGSTVCAPSRCALLTGLHTGHCFVRGNHEVHPIGQLPIPDEAMTLPEMLQQAGYVTGMFGKWGLGYPGSEGDPMNQGFDEFFGYNCQRQAHRYYPEFLWHNRERVELGGQVYAHELIVCRALAFIEQHQNVPFFCYVPVTIPHAAMELPEDEKEPFRKQFAEFEDTAGSYADTNYKNPIAAFAAMVTRLDSDVGRIVDLLEKLELTENTLVIFTSDNGPHREGGHDPDFFGSSAGFRGIKRDLYEGGIRVPTIVRWSGHISAGQTSDDLSAFWDWLPTLCEIAQFENDLPPHDGISLVPTLLGQSGKRHHEQLYWEFHEQGGKQAIRVGKWKAIRLDVGDNPNGPLELYDLSLDPQEKTNLADKHPRLVEDLAERMSASRIPSQHFRFGRVQP